MKKLILALSLFAFMGNVAIARITQLKIVGTFVCELI